MKRMIWGIIAIAVLSAVPAAAEIKRSVAAKDEFKREHPCPANGARRGICPGYVIDHIVALACGGPDAPGNMQWQTVAAGKAKDKWERKDCDGRETRQ